MTITACDRCFHGDCERCTSTLCACCGEREVATVTSLPFTAGDQLNVDAMFEALGLDDDIEPSTYNYEIPVV